MTDPDPVPLAPAVTDNQEEAPLVAVQLQPPGIVTVTVPVPEVEDTDCVAGDTVDVHETPA